MAKAGRLIYEVLLAAWDGFWVVWSAQLFWLLLCLPVITLPLAFGGLYASAHALAYGESITWRSFFEGAKRNFFTALRWCLANGVVFALLGFYAWFFGGPESETQSGLVAGTAIALAILWLVLNLYTFPFMLIQEKRSFFQALRNSLVMQFKWPGLSLGFTLFILLILLLSIWTRFLWLLFAASLPALLACRLVRYVYEETIPESGDIT